MKRQNMRRVDSTRINEECSADGLIGFSVAKVAQLEVIQNFTE